LYNILHNIEGKIVDSLEKPEGKKPLGKARRRWEDNIIKGVQEIGWRAWTGLIWLGTRTNGEIL
jgi:hypothetical protein